jgi:hypothetical protein
MSARRLRTKGCGDALPRAFALVIALGVWLALALQPAGAEEGNFTLRGRVVDNAGHGVAGAEVALYTNPDVRRPADFAAPPSATDGSYAVVVPAGRYWVVARQRREGQAGPLAPGDRHSGEPVEVAGSAGGAVAADFTVATVREMGQRRESSAEELVTLTGRLLGPDGKPLAGAYVFARRAREGGEVPEFVSPWSDASGAYTLVLPPGRYFLGTDTVFPPRRERILHEKSLSAGKLDVVMDMAVPLQ